MWNTGAWSSRLGSVPAINECRTAKKICFSLVTDRSRKIIKIMYCERNNERGRSVFCYFFRSHITKTFSSNKNPFRLLRPRSEVRGPNIMSYSVNRPSAICTKIFTDFSNQCGVSTRSARYQLLKLPKNPSLLSMRTAR